MFFIKALYCRIFQICFRLALPILPYREPEIIKSVDLLNTVISKEKLKSILIVTDKGIVNNGLTQSIEKTLKENKVKYVLYDKTQPNPTVDNVEEAFKLYKDFNCDSIITVGGGSSMDCAKAVGAKAAYPKKSIGKMKGILRVLKKIPTLIAVPTTAGTGSETTLAAIVTDSKTHHKYALMSFPLIPKSALLDASLTYSLPMHLTST